MIQLLAEYGIQSAPVIDLVVRFLFCVWSQNLFVCWRQSPFNVFIGTMTDASFTL